MADYIIYHNTQCTKSLAVHQILTEAGVQFTERFYVDEPPTLDELDGLVTLLKAQPIDIVRIQEEQWKWSGLTSTAEPHDIFALITQHPVILERPIIVKDQKSAIIGRPPEIVKTLLDL